MLINYKVANVLSFKEPQTFSMEAGKFRNNSSRLTRYGNYKLLKFMSIYGANASGKSNLVSAFAIFQAIIIEGFKNKSFPVYCKIDESLKNEESLFEIKVLLDNKIFIYGFKAILYNGEFTSEWLYEELKNGTTKNVFSRNIQKGEFELGEYINNKKIEERINIYGEDIKSDNSVLFLKLMNQNKNSLYENKDRISIFKDLYLWIKYSLDVNSPETPITGYTMLNNDSGIKRIAEMLSSFSTGIVDFDIIEVPSEKVASSLPKNMIEDIQKKLMDQKKMHDPTDTEFKPAVSIRLKENGNIIFIIELNKDNEFEFKTMSFKHKNSNALFLSDEESDGTIRLLNIIEVLLTSENDKVYIIDEINRKFHPLLTRKFVEKFLQLAEQRNIQLIVTTHESQLMDLKLLRRDEISFINKDDYGYSHIYSLDSYEDRFDKKIINDYLNGRYGAIPIFE